MTRFWQKVERTDSCWLWKAVLNQNGYRTFRFNRRTQLAHRVAWQLRYGEIPEKACVCHRCDVRACVNPEHLFIGSYGDNNRDMRAKGRATMPPRMLGTANVNAKLTPEAVMQIRASSATQVELAKRFGVAQAQISAIKLGQTWRHV